MQGPGSAGLSLGTLPLSANAVELKSASQAILDEAASDLEKVLAREGTRTVANTLEPIDRILLRVLDVQDHGSTLFSVHTSADVRTAAREASEASHRFFSAFFVNRAAYDALQAIDWSDAPPLARRASEKLLLEMRRSGVELDLAKREAMRKLSDEIDGIQFEFMDQLTKPSQAVEVASAAEFAGLPEDYIRQHPPDAQGRCTLSTAYTDVFPVLSFARSADLRRRVLGAFYSRAYPQNEEVLRRLLTRRREFSDLLGYPSYAAYAMEDKMMRTPEAAWGFLDRIAELLRPPAARDRDTLLARKRQDDPTAARLDPWDVAGGLGHGFFEEQLKTERFRVDSKSVREYLPYAQVRDGLFSLCERLFAIEIRRVEPSDLWHPSVEAYDVLRGGELLGRFFLDLVPREGKFNHAAQFTLRTGVLGRQLPQAVLVCNFFASTTEAERSLFRYEDVVTFFHESGHLLHHIFSGHTAWTATSGAWIETDFIEAPSQLFEEWARDPSLLVEFARHWKTGEPMPREIAERLVEAERFGRAFRWLSQVGAAAASLDLYERDPSSFEAGRLMRETFARYGLVPLPESSHFECSWGHLTGYSALYYTYAWSLVIARDLLGPFLEKGTLLDPALAQRYVKEILAPGASAPPQQLVENYLGRPLSYEAFEQWVTMPSTATTPANAP
ncbi:MAG: Zn-dependent oligopeptidase [Thermoplasmata archaeon]|nr:Zn-dependent oligopeptidase [Thermoplasmata archaeon]